MAGVIIRDVLIGSYLAVKDLPVVNKQSKAVTAIKKWQQLWVVIGRSDTSQWLLAVYRDKNSWVHSQIPLTVHQIMQLCSFSDRQTRDGFHMFLLKFTSGYKISFACNTPKHKSEWLTAVKKALDACYNKKQKVTHKSITDDDWWQLSECDNSEFKVSVDSCSLSDNINRCRVRLLHEQSCIEVYAYSTYSSYTIQWTWLYSQLHCIDFDKKTLTLTVQLYISDSLEEICWTGKETTQLYTILRNVPGVFDYTTQASEVVPDISSTLVGLEESDYTSVGVFLPDYLLQEMEQWYLVELVYCEHQRQLLGQYEIQLSLTHVHLRGCNCPHHWSWELHHIKSYSLDTNQLIIEVEGASDAWSGVFHFCSDTHNKVVTTLYHLLRQLMVKLHLVVMVKQQLLVTRKQLSTIMSHSQTPHSAIECFSCELLEGPSQNLLGQYTVQIFVDQVHAISSNAKWVWLLTEIYSYKLDKDEAGGAAYVTIEISNSTSAVIEQWVWSGDHMIRFYSFLLELCQLLSQQSHQEVLISQVATVRLTIMQSVIVTAYTIKLTKHELFLIDCSDSERVAYSYPLDCIKSLNLVEGKNELIICTDEIPAFKASEVVIASECAQKLFMLINMAMEKRQLPSHNHHAQQMVRQSSTESHQTQLYAQQPTDDDGDIANVSDKQVSTKNQKVKHQLQTETCTEPPQQLLQHDLATDDQQVPNAHYPVGMDTTYESSWEVYQPEVEQKMVETEEIKHQEISMFDDWQVPVVTMQAQQYPVETHATSQDVSCQPVVAETGQAHEIKQWQTSTEGQQVPTIHTQHPLETHGTDWYQLEVENKQEMVETQEIKCQQTSTPMLINDHQMVTTMHTQHPLETCTTHETSWEQPEDNDQQVVTTLHTHYPVETHDTNWEHPKVQEIVQDQQIPIETQLIPSSQEVSHKVPYHQHVDEDETIMMIDTLAETNTSWETSYHPEMVEKQEIKHQRISIPVDDHQATTIHTQYPTHETGQELLYRPEVVWEMNEAQEIKYQQISIQADNQQVPTIHSHKIHETAQFSYQPGVETEQKMVETQEIEYPSKDHQQQVAVIKTHTSNHGFTFQLPKTEQKMIETQKIDHQQTSTVKMTTTNQSLEDEQQVPQKNVCHSSSSFQQVQENTHQSSSETQQPLCEGKDSKQFTNQATNKVHHITQAQTQLESHQVLLEREPSLEDQQVPKEYTYQLSDEVKDSELSYQHTVFTAMQTSVEVHKAKHYSEILNEPQNTPDQLKEKTLVETTDGHPPVETQLAVNECTHITGQCTDQVEAEQTSPQMQEVLNEAEGDVQCSQYYYANIKQPSNDPSQQMKHLASPTNQVSSVTVLPSQSTEAQLIRSDDDGQAKSQNVLHHQHTEDDNETMIMDTMNTPHKTDEISWKLSYHPEVVKTEREMVIEKQEVKYQRKSISSDDPRVPATTEVLPYQPEVFESEPKNVETQELKHQQISIPIDDQHPTRTINTQHPGETITNEELMHTYHPKVIEEIKLQQISIPVDDHQIPMVTTATTIHTQYPIETNMTHETGQELLYHPEVVWETTEAQEIKHQQISRQVDDQQVPTMHTHKIYETAQLSYQSGVETEQKMVETQEIEYPSKDHQQQVAVIRTHTTNHGLTFQLPKTEQKMIETQEIDHQQTSIVKMTTTNQSLEDEQQVPQKNVCHSSSSFQQVQENMYQSSSETQQPLCEGKDNKQFTNQATTKVHHITQTQTQLESHQVLLEREPSLEDQQVPKEYTYQLSDEVKDSELSYQHPVITTMQTSVEVHKAKHYSEILNEPQNTPDQLKEGTSLETTGSHPPVETQLAVNECTHITGQCTDVEAEQTSPQMQVLIETEEDVQCSQHQMERNEPQHSLTEKHQQSFAKEYISIATAELGSQISVKSSMLMSQEGETQQETASTDDQQLLTMEAKEILPSNSIKFMQHLPTEPLHKIDDSKESLLIGSKENHFPVKTYTNPLEISQTPVKIQELPSETSHISKAQAVPNEATYEIRHVSAENVVKKTRPPFLLETQRTVLHEISIDYREETAKVQKVCHETLTSDDPHIIKQQLKLSELEPQRASFKRQEITYKPPNHETSLTLLEDTEVKNRNNNLTMDAISPRVPNDMVTFGGSQEVKTKGQMTPTATEQTTFPVQATTAQETMNQQCEAQKCIDPLHVEFGEDVAIVNFTDSYHQMTKHRINIVTIIPSDLPYHHYQLHIDENITSTGEEILSMCTHYCCDYHVMVRITKLSQKKKFNGVSTSLKPQYDLLSTRKAIDELLLKYL